MSLKPLAPKTSTVTPSSTVSCGQRHQRFSASDVRALETAVGNCVGTGDHCTDCRRIATFLRVGCKHSGFAPRSQAATTADALLGMLSSFSSRLERREIPRDAAHNQLSSELATFFRQAQAKRIHDTVVRNGYLISLLRRQK